MSDDEGWIYAISNPEMSTLLKIGMTMRTPQERLAEANTSNTWKPPSNYKIEFAKKVKNPLQKEKTIHKLLEQYNERVNRSREFFRITVEKARLYFDLMDGEYLEIIEEDPIPQPKKQRGRGQKHKNKPVSTDNTFSPPSTRVSPYVSREVSPIRLSVSTHKPKCKSKIVDKTGIINANVKDLTQEETTILLNNAYATKSLDISLKSKYYTFEKLHTILLRDIEETEFVAIMSSPTHPDVRVRSENIEWVLDKIILKTDSTFILLTSI